MLKLTREDKNKGFS